ncbi:MAG TPA: aminomethyl-transferring glycine dehydrogenase subunit GcvPA [Myxococcota bacterium]|nr:aminomethyl-transferring glycine dehydrogenase subunit GcvPA [Myxococcota bacterium]
MRYIPHTEADVRHMLDVIGVPDIGALLAAVPEKLRLGRPLDLPEATSEQTLMRELRTLAERNASPATHDWFLGAGTYAHFVPSAVDALVSRSEFYTAYTPYQPEISQGTLQVVFEWQSMMSELTGLPVANASMYDGASATAEAGLMAMRVTRRDRIVVAGGLHPHYRQVLETYVGGLGAEVVAGEITPDGRAAPVADLVDDRTACVILQQPGFFGGVQDVRSVAEAAHACGALLVVTTTEALSLALLESPGALGADIACGEAQSFGVPMSFGGPHLGFLATAQKHLRQLPGRIVGETVDTTGRRGFVLTLSTREQHIRRERATSNICTNQGLCLLMATIYLSLHGKVGLGELAAANLAKAEYAKSRVRATPGLSLPYAGPTFNEFVVGLPGPADAVLARAAEAKLIAGLDLAPYAPELGPALLVCTTELASREAIDRLVDVLAQGGAP